MPSYFAHKTAEIDDGAIVGNGSKIWHWTHISAGTSIGENCSLGQNVYAGSKVVIGKNCKIQNNVSLYDGVILEDGVFCGPSMVFTNVYNPRALVERKDQFRKTVVKEGASLGANCTIVCGVTIGRYAFIGAGTVINKDVKPFALMVGVPGKQIGWMSKFGERIDLPLNGNEKFVCKNSNEIYVLKNNSLTLEEK